MTDETPIKAVVNVATGETTYVPLTAEEIAEREASFQLQQERETARLAAEAEQQALRDSAKAKLIAGEPLTAEEADVLVL